MARWRALTTPVVMVWERPKGLPMAMTGSPIIRSSEVPKGAAGTLPAASILRMARSNWGSEPTSVAGNSFPSRVPTIIEAAWAMTW